MRSLSRALEGDHFNSILANFSLNPQVSTLTLTGEHF